MEWVILAVAVSVLLLAGLGITAWLVPVHQLHSRARDLPQRPDEIWRVLTNFEDYPQWRRGLRSVTRVPSAPHEELWRESYARGGRTLRTDIEEPGRVLCRHIAGRHLQFGGVWRFELEAQRAGGTRLRITAAAEYYRPMQRLFARFISGEASAIERFMADLAKELARQNPMGPPSRRNG